MSRGLGNEDLLAPEQQGAATAYELLAGDLQTFLPRKPEPEDALEQPSADVVDHEVPGFIEQELGHGSCKSTFSGWRNLPAHATACQLLLCFPPPSASHPRG